MPPVAYARASRSCRALVSAVASAPCLDRALAVLPVRIAQLALEELARRLARQLVREVDRARPLELGEPSREALHDRGPQHLVRRDTRRGLDDRLDLLAHVVVGNAEHRDVADPRMGEDLALDLGGIDVHAARDDHVALAVA